MPRKNRETKKPGDTDVNGFAIPKYIVHGGPGVAVEKGLSGSECQYFDEQPKSEEHRRNTETMWERWVHAGAEHVYP
jgi:hypothetical protein